MQLRNLYSMGVKNLAITDTLSAIIDRQVSVVCTVCSTYMNLGDCSALFVRCLIVFYCQ